jgi:hypothetical protein
VAHKIDRTSFTGIYLVDECGPRYVNKLQLVFLVSDECWLVLLDSHD